jgi:hypothetical protein
MLRDTFVTIALFMVFTGMVAVSASYPLKAGLVPLVIGIPALLLSCWQLWRGIAERRGLGRGREPSGVGADDAPHEWIAMLWLSVFTLLVLVGGFIAGGTLAVMASQRFWLRESWRTAVTGGGIAFLVTHVFFERALGLLLFGGWLAEWARR